MSNIDNLIKLTEELGLYDNHAHTSRIIDWKLDANANYIPKTYGCTECDTTSDTPLSSGRVAEAHTHTTYVEGCFACKIPTLQLNTGDANSNKAMPSKRWNSELDAYADARAQGVQPAGTSMTAVEDALRTSETLGRAYDANVDPPTKMIDKATANVMTEVGM